MQANLKILAALSITVVFTACVQPRSSLSAVQQDPGRSTQAAPVTYDLASLAERRLLLAQCDLLRDGLNDFARSNAPGAGGVVFQKVTVTRVWVENLQLSDTGTAGNRLITGDVMVELADAQRNRFALAEGVAIGSPASDFNPIIVDEETGKPAIRGSVFDRGRVGIIARLLNADSVLKVDSFPKLLERAVADLASEAVRATSGFDRPISIFNVLQDLKIGEELEKAKAANSYTAGLIREVVDRRVREARIARELEMETKGSAGTRDAHIASVRSAVLQDLTRLSEGQLPEVNRMNTPLNRGLIAQVSSVLRSGGR